MVVEIPRFSQAKFEINRWGRVNKQPLFVLPLYVPQLYVPPPCVPHHSSLYQMVLIYLFLGYIARSHSSYANWPSTILYVSTICLSIIWPSSICHSIISPSLISLRYNSLYPSYFHYIVLDVRPLFLSSPYICRCPTTICIAVIFISTICISIICLFIIS